MYIILMIISLGERRISKQAEKNVGKYYIVIISLCYNSFLKK